MIDETRNGVPILTILSMRSLCRDAANDRNAACGFPLSYDHPYNWEDIAKERGLTHILLQEGEDD